MAGNKWKGKCLSRGKRRKGEKILWITAILILFLLAGAGETGDTSSAGPGATSALRELVQWGSGQKKCQLEESPSKYEVNGNIITIQRTRENCFKRQSWGKKKKKRGLEACTCRTGWP